MLNASQSGPGRTLPHFPGIFSQPAALPKGWTQGEKPVRPAIYGARKTHEVVPDPGPEAIPAEPKRRAARGEAGQAPPALPVLSDSPHLINTWSVQDPLPISRWRQQ